MQVSAKLIASGDYGAKDAIKMSLDVFKDIKIPVLVDNLIAKLFGNSSYVK